MTWTESCAKCRKYWRTGSIRSLNISVALEKLSHMAVLLKEFLSALDDDEASSGVENRRRRR
jgi:hypothetical protein